MTWRLLFFVLAAFCFLVAVIIDFGSATYTHANALVPAGLFFLAVGLCVPSRLIMTRRAP